MTKELVITNETCRSLHNVQRELPDADNIEDAIRTLSWQYAQDNENLKVKLSGGIEYVEEIEARGNK